MAKPLIDRHELLERVSGNKEFAALMLSTFFDSLPDRIDLLKNDLHAKDFDNLADNAHKMKGVVGNLAIHKTFDLLKDLHREARQKDLKKASKLVSQIEESLFQAKTFYETLEF